MNLISLLKGFVVLLIGIVIVLFSASLMRSAEFGIAVALVYLAAINVANNVYGEKK